MMGLPCSKGRVFRSTLPLRGATACVSRVFAQAQYFDPRSPCGERRSTPSGAAYAFTDFDPRSPCGERPRFTMSDMLFSIFRSTLPLRGATQGLVQLIVAKQFRSTLPLRGATLLSVSSVLSLNHFDPRSPCGERHDGGGERPVRVVISIHAPLAGSDLVRTHVAMWVARHFDPRSPCGERRDVPRDGWLRSAISIHAPLAGSDRRIAAFRGQTTGHFDPRSPCGERLGLYKSPHIRKKFRSTLPLRGATPCA